MFKKISKFFTLIILSLFIISTDLFTSTHKVNAVQNSLDNTEENSLGIVIEKNSGNTDDPKTSSVPDLGDDQAFPFIPGFGKNSGKD